MKSLLVFIKQENTLARLQIAARSYVVKVLAVLKHPVQGDLHNVKQADVPFFHERRALAFREQTNIPEQMVKKYEGEIPDYTDSLKLALKLK